MARSWEEILVTIRQRQSANSPLLAAMDEITVRYNGDFTIPYLTDEEWAERLPPLTPALIAEGVDQLAMRAASVMPAITVPAVKPGNNASMVRASKRRKALGYCYDQSRFRLVNRRAMRHLAAFSTMCLVVVPDFKTGMPRIEARNPMFAYPDLNEMENLRPPTNVAFIYGRSPDWLRSRYPQARAEVGGVVPPVGRFAAEELWDVVEYWEEDELVMGILGTRPTPDKLAIPLDRDAILRGSDNQELRRWPNQAEMIPVVCPTRVTLTKVASQLSHVVGITDMMAMLQALDVIASEKSIFPDMYILSTEGREAELVNGAWVDGRYGEVNIVKNASAIGTINTQPSQAGQMAIDRQERNARISAGISPSFTGETAGALRTGRAVDTLTSAQVDHRIQEMQVIMEDWLPHLHDAVFSTFEGYWGRQKYEVFSGWPSDEGLVDFVPDKDFKESHASVARYSIAGADAQFTNINLGQMLAAGAISKDTFRDRHPWIDDPDGERRRVKEEQMEELAMQLLQQRAGNGELPFQVIALLEEHYRSEEFADIFTALRATDKAMRQQQATPAPEAPPGLVAAPETQPGLEAGAGGVVQPPPTVARPTPGQDNLRRVMAALRAGQRTG